MQQEKATLEERSATLEQRATTLQQQLMEATAGERDARATLTKVQDELSEAKAALTSIDSARLQEIEATKAAVDHELQKAQSKLREEEEKFRTLSETERELRSEVTGIKVCTLDDRVAAMC